MEVFTHYDTNVTECPGLFYLNSFHLLTTKYDISKLIL